LAGELKVQVAAVVRGRTEKARRERLWNGGGILVPDIGNAPSLPPTCTVGNGSSVTCFGANATHRPDEKAACTDDLERACVDREGKQTRRVNGLH
jgi:hypothetical protein